MKEVELLKSTEKGGLTVLGVPVVKGKGATLHIKIGGVDIIENLQAPEIVIVLKEDE
ncbi:MAG: hypothetical protein WC365_06565 [Candidatus Babeliales bacterium]|jgi:hypothetical protein